MNLFKTYFLFLIIFLIISCNQEVIEQTETKTTIVEGYLAAGNSIDSLRVTQSYSLGQAEEELVTLDDLNITIADDKGQYELRSIGNGRYQNSNLIIRAGENYKLEFERDGEIISAETHIPEFNATSISTTLVGLNKIEAGVFPTGGITIPDPVELSWNNEEGDYYYVVIRNIETDPEYVNDNLARFDEQLSFISEPQIADFYAIRTLAHLTQFGTYQIIVFRVNPEYAALFGSSGSSTLSLEAPVTNIVNGLGIFTGVSSDTLYLEVTKL